MNDDVEGLAHKMIEFYERMSSWEHGVVKGSGLSPAQMHAIEILGMYDSCRMKELAEKLGVTTGSLTVMVDRLEKRGLLVRRPHESDRRSYMVALTDRGREHYASHHKFHLKLTQDMAAVLTREELEAFEGILEKVLPQI
jgi:DNA-binding MarR family transcriptional regulator